MGKRSFAGDLENVDFHSNGMKWLQMTSSKPDTFHFYLVSISKTAWESQGAQNDARMRN